MLWVGAKGIQMRECMSSGISAPHEIVNKRQSVAAGGDLLKASNIGCILAEYWYNIGPMHSDMGPILGQYWLMIYHIRILAYANIGPILANVTLQFCPIS